MAEAERKCVDYTNVHLDNQRLPIKPVKSKLIWKTDEPAFQNIVRQFEESPTPGFFLTTERTGREVRVRSHLNRHCILSSDIFYGPNGKLYRDVDAKGVGYTRGIPIRFLGVRDPEMEGDMEKRGIMHHEVALEDCLISEEISPLVRVARPIALIELFELVEQDGRVVSREEVGKRLYSRFELVRPTIAIRAMGVTSRVYDLLVQKEIKNEAYVKEIIDDALGFVQQELQRPINPEDYVTWFAETMGRQLGTLHKNKMWTDFSCQIHQGTHNLTLDCRLTDTHHYVTPKSTTRYFEQVKREIERDPRLGDMFAEQMRPHTKEEIDELKKEGEQVDKQAHYFVLDQLVRGVSLIYVLGNVASNARVIFDRAFEQARA